MAGGFNEIKEENIHQLGFRENVIMSMDTDLLGARHDSSLEQAN